MLLPNSYKSREIPEHGTATDIDLDAIEREYSGYSNGSPKDTSLILRLVRELREVRQKLAESERKKPMLRSDAGGKRKPSGLW